VGLQQPDGTHPLLIAAGRPGGGIAWSSNSWWGQATFPSHARTSAIPWAVIDHSLEWEAEGIADIPAAFDDDPDGPEGRNRQELLPWVYDRHLERGNPHQAKRGTVAGAIINLRIEYVGSSGQDALRRPAGAHHKVPTILGRMLLYEPHRLVYLLACTVRIAGFDRAAEADGIVAQTLADFVSDHAVERGVLIAAAEDAMIASAAAPYNKRNTSRRRFPDSAAGRKLAALGVERVVVALHGLPEQVRLSGSSRYWTSETGVLAFQLT
jgi:hypothetical protein